MTDDYKLGYENGRYSVLEELGQELSRRRDPLFKKLLNSDFDEHDAGILEAFNNINEWQLKKREEELSDD